MAYLARDDSRRSTRPLRAVEPPRAVAQDPRDGLPEALFTGLNAFVFLILAAAVVAAAILYSQGH
jgi:hypothetical protein